MKDFHHEDRVEREQHARGEWMLRSEQDTRYDSHLTDEQMDAVLARCKAARLAREGK